MHRCSGSTKADAVRLALGDRPENKAITEWAERNSVPFSAGLEENLLRRHLQVAERHGIDTVVRITGDCPLIPPAEIDRIIQLQRANSAGYTTNVVAEISKGFVQNAIDVDVLRELSELEKSHPVLPFRENPERWVSVFSSNDHWTALAEIDVSIDTPTDYWEMVDAVADVGSNPRALCEWILQESPIEKNEG
ncbi:spore coat polysaccharide biosynthesis protein SpsF [Salinibacter ruber]|nr:spore coat polysaccharide biosynthesis protein SpsF [Salinibacter ruber]